MSVFHENMLIGASGQVAAGGISRSLRFNSSDSAYLSRTPASAGNRRTWTFSCWLKRSLLGSSFQTIFSAGTGGNAEASIRFNSDDTLEFYAWTGGYNARLLTTQVFRDVSAWYHLVVVFDTPNATADQRIRLYVNGIEITTFSSRTNPTPNYDGYFNNSISHTIGDAVSGASPRFFNGYLADIHFIDGQALTPSSFTEVSATTGQLIPKAYTGSYGTNGFKLTFSDNSGTTSTTLGKDAAGSNNWSPNNFSVASGSGNDSLVDTPTSYGTDTGAGGEVRGNYCTMNPLDAASGAALTLTNGNLEHTNPSTNWRWRRGTFAMTTGKWYWEQTVSDGATASTGYLAGVATSSFDFNIGTAGLYARQSSTQYNNGSSSTPFSTTTAGDVLGFAFDADAGKLWVSRNGTFVGSPTAGTGNSWSNVPSGVFPLFAAYNVAGNIMNFGQRPFAYAAPSGFKALCDTNLAPPLVAKPNTVMDVKLYTGNGSTQTISGLGFSPDFVWIKNRADGESHGLFDQVRGADLWLSSNTTGAETNYGGGFGVTAFTSSGFTVGNGTAINATNKAQVAWTWDAGSSTVTNTQGSITSSVRANASAGFSVVSYTGNGSSGATIGHSLGVKPYLIILKARTQAYNWTVYHNSLGATKFLQLNNTNAVGTATSVWNDTEPTSTVFTVGNDIGENGNGTTFIAYCFAPVTGYSSFGSYTGNGSSDGPFVYTGFRPKFIMRKRSDSTGDWIIMDTSRDSFNQVDKRLNPNLSNAEASGGNIVDILSNGWKERNLDGYSNASGGTYVWAAFAESPFQFSRAR